MSAIIAALLLLFQAPEQPKLATLEGAVTHAISKTPIRKAKVTLTSVSSESATTAVDTADDGKFVLKDVKPGRYRLNAAKAGYETTAYGARRVGESIGQILRVDPGAELTRLDIALPKHGVIAGKVLDSDNEPVSKVLVLALSSMYYQNGKKTRLPRGTLPVMSNDLGEYRVGELPPGKYIVCAIPAGFYQPSTDLKESKPGAEEISVTTCYPNVGEMNDAAAVEIRDSAEISATDIRLIKARTVTVQGKVTGAPAGSGTITILNLNRKGVGPIGNVLNPRTVVQSADGRFEFKNVPPGSYILHTLPTGLGNMPFVVKAALEIGNQPVTDLTVPALAPFEMKAAIKAEPGPELKLPSLRVVLTPADGVTSSLAMGTADADGKLTLANVVPGRHQLAIAGVPYTHYIKEVRTADQVSEDDTVEISGGEELTITLALGKGEINGTVRNEKGEPVSGVTVGLVPDPRKPFRLRMTRTDQSGAYKVPSVAPGEYSLIALESVEAGALDDDEFLGPFRSKMTKVKVEEGASQTINLSLLPQR